MNDSEDQLPRKRTGQAETPAKRQKLALFAMAAFSRLRVLLVRSYIRRSIQMQHTEAGKGSCGIALQGMAS